MGSAQRPGKIVAAFAVATAALAGGLVLLPVWRAPAAETAGPPAAVSGFERFIAEAQPACREKPAAACIVLGWEFADRNRDLKIGADELAALRQEFYAWSEWRRPRMGERDRAVLAVAKLVARSLDLPEIVAGYDSDGDGALTPQELLADVALDDRPLGEILLDREAVDWNALSRRLGAAAPLLGALSAPAK